MKNQKGLLAMCCIMTTLLASCGSSSSGSKGNSGVFADAPVVGLSYACGTQKGVTGTGGTFTCAGGSTVTFTVGGITLCSEPAQPFMTPLSCAQATDPSANTSTPSVLAETRFLLSISTTPASSGTLTITASELTAAAGLTLDFSTASDTQLAAAVDTVTANPTAALVDATTAENELISTVDTALAGKYAGTFSGGDSGTWAVTIASDGTVSGPLPAARVLILYQVVSFPAQRTAAVPALPLGPEQWIPPRPPLFSAARGAIRRTARL